MNELDKHVPDDLWEDDDPLEDEDDGLPPIHSLRELSKIVSSSPEAPEIITGVLRQGCKMVFTGPSKAGKSFAMIELTLCLAAGKPWLGHFECKPGKVLYVNLEIDFDSVLWRFHDVCEALFPEDVGKHPTYIENITLWNLRGYCVNWPKFVNTICRRDRNCEFEAIIMDPFYKLNAGSENNAYQMAQFTNGLDRITMETGAAVIYCHHHSKGEQGFKSSMDRGSGSGVFARDADAILDVIELELPPERQREGVTAWRIEGSLREFPKFDPVDVWFNYPIHVMERFDPAENIAPHHELPSYQRAMNARKPKEQKLKERRHRLDAAIDLLEAQSIETTTSSIAAYLGVTNKAVRYMVDENPNFERDLKTGQVRRVQSTHSHE